MKIKQVCDQTGLTERTIRFYIEKGLLAPASKESNDRVYIEFSGDDVLRIEQIAVLRKIGFSVSAIAEMFENPALIEQHINAHYGILSEESKTISERLAALDKIARETFSSVADLCGALHWDAETMELPAWETGSFSAKLDPEPTKEEREHALADFMRRQDKRDKVAAFFRPLKYMALVLCAAGFALLVVYVISCVPHTVRVEYDGVQYRLSEPEKKEMVHIRADGKLTNKLFSEPMFEGYLEVSSVDYTINCFSVCSFTGNEEQYSGPVYYYTMSVDSPFVLFTDRSFSYVYLKFWGPGKDGGIFHDIDLVIAAPWEGEFPNP